MTSRTWRLLLGATGIALATRFAHLVAFSDLDVNPLFKFPIMDAAMHDKWARELLAGAWPGNEPFFRAPFYVFFLAGLYAVFGADNRLPIYLVHALVSALGGGLAALCAAKVWGERAGWFAGVIYAGLWTSIFFSAELLLETPFVTLVLLLVWVLLARDGAGAAMPGVRTLFLAGLIWGIAAITRPTVLSVAPVIVWYLAAARGVRRPIAWAALVVGLALPILPITAHNIWRGHDAVLIASQGGVNFYIGNNPISDGRTAYVPGTRPTWQGGFDDVNALAAQETGRQLRPSEVDRHYFRKGLAFWAQQPLSALRLYAHKVRLLLAAGERSNNKNDYFWRARSIVLRWPIWLGWAPVMFLAVLGYFRRDLAPQRRLLLLGLAVAYALSVWLFFVNSRFRLPILALLTIPAGAGLERLWVAVRTRRWSDGRVGPLVAGCLLLFSLVPDWIRFTENRGDRDPFSWHTLGNGYYAAGKLDQAREAYARAVFINEHYPQRHFQWIEESLYTALGETLLRLGRSAEAQAAYEGWVRFNPNSVAARLRLGDLLLQRGETDAAGAQFEVALRDDPENSRAQLGQGWVLRAQGNPALALRRFRSLAGRESDVQALFGEGLCLIDLERFGEAEPIFLEILRLQPNYWQAFGNLAGLYDRTGRPDLARQMYRRLLEVNPDDPLARRWLAEHP